MRAPESLADMWVQVAADPRGDADATAGVLAESEANAATLAGLAWLDHWRLSAAGRVDRLAAIRRHLAYLSAAQTRMLADYAAERQVDDCAAMEVAPALQLSQQSASARMTQAAYIARVLPTALNALELGDITEAHLRALVDAVHALPDPLAQRIEGRVLARATGTSLPRWRAVIRRAVLELDARNQADKHTAAREQRRVAHSPAPDGMSEIWAFLPAEHAQHVNAAINHVARLIRYDNDPRTTDQLRADALTSIADDVLTGTTRTTDQTAATAGSGSGSGSGSGRPTCATPDNTATGPTAAGPAATGPTATNPAAGGQTVTRTAAPTPAGAAAARLTVNVTVPASVLFGHSTAPGELAGYGPITADHARDLAALTDHIRFLVTDEHGRLLVRAASTYRIPIALSEHIKTRDQHCTFPGCRARAVHCDIDHLTAWPDGPTHQAALHALCRRHHRVKQRPGWHVTRNEHTGTTTWHSPTGHLYPTEPPPLPGDSEDTD